MLNIVVGVLQAPAADPTFFQAWQDVGVVGILVAVLTFGGWVYNRLLAREQARADTLDTENTNLVRQNEHMSLEAIRAVRELSGELKELNEEVSKLRQEVALLLARLGREK
jgi:hypothetical protein